MPWHMKINWQRIEQNKKLVGYKAHITANGIGDEMGGRLTARIELGVAIQPDGSHKWAAQFKPRTKRVGDSKFIARQGQAASMNDGAQQAKAALEELAAEITEYTRREYPSRTAELKFWS